jgi:hypothetical protein
MDPISALGIALSVAGLAGQVFMGAIQGIQFIVTAKDMPKDCQYLNLRLRIEEQRLFAWSETSGLMDFQAQNKSEALQTNTFGLHRSTILDLLIQIQVDLLYRLYDLVLMEPGPLPRLCQTAEEA